MIKFISVPCSLFLLFLFFLQLTAHHFFEFSIKPIPIIILIKGVCRLIIDPYVSSQAVSALAGAGAHLIVSIFCINHFIKKDSSFYDFPDLFVLFFCLRILYKMLIYRKLHNFFYFFLVLACIKKRPFYTLWEIIE